MLYLTAMFMLSGFLGTILALRLMALEAEEYKSTLTKRGKIVISIAIGIAMALLVTFISGMWWDCDLTKQSRPCRIFWGY